TGIRNWHWVALFGSGYHLARALERYPRRWSWHLLGFFAFASIGFMIGYDFIAMQGLFCLGVALLVSGFSLRPRGLSLVRFGTVAAGFILPFVLRQLQILGYLGLDFWWHDLYYSAVIKTSFLNRWFPLEDLGTIDDWYIQQHILRPAASPETNPAII